MTCADTEVTTISAPGKVLLAGGYLILDPEFSGLVFALNARIYVQIVFTLPSSACSTPSPKVSTVLVKSPQFLEATWEYGYELAKDDCGIRLTQIPS